MREISLFTAGSLSFRFLFLVLQKDNYRGLYTDLHAKYVKRRGSAQGCALGVLKPKSKGYDAHPAGIALLEVVIDCQCRV